MQKKTYLKLTAVTVLASSLLLGACGNKKENTTSDNSSKTTQTSSSSKTTSSSKDSKTQNSSSRASSEKTKTSSDQSATTTEQSQATPAPESRQGQAETQQAPSTQQGSQAQSNQSNYDPTTDRKLQDRQAEHNPRYKGVLNMVDGDFSSAAGSWKGENGETITVSSGGQFTVESADGKKENYSIKGYSYTLDDGKYNAKIGSGKVIQITTGADGTVSSVVMTKR